MDSQLQEALKKRATTKTLSPEKLAELEAQRAEAAKKALVEGLESEKANAE